MRFYSHHKAQSAVKILGLTSLGLSKDIPVLPAGCQEGSWSAGKFWDLLCIPKECCRTHSSAPHMGWEEEKAPTVLEFKTTLV